MTAMFWNEQIEHFRWLASTEVAHREEYIQRRREQHDAGEWQAIDHLASEGLHGFFGNGPAYSHETIGAMASFLPAAVATYAEEVSGEQPLSTAALGVLDTVCMYELMGCAVDPALLARLAPLLGRVETSRHDDRAKHWHRGFAALALKSAAVWRGIAGLAPGALTFSPGESFGPNVQGLLGYLAAAVEHRAAVADVEPAWKTLLAAFGALYDAGELDFEALFWIARVVYHDIGGEPLGRAGERLWADLQDVAAAGL